MLILRVGAVSLLSDEDALFRHHAIQTEHAKTGREAVEYIDLYEYDLVLLSFSLSDMLVSHAINLIRRVNATIPIVVIARRARSTTRGLVIDRGADDFLVGPITLCEILARLRAAIRRSVMIRQELATPQMVTISPPAVKARMRTPIAGTVINTVNNTLIVHDRRVPLAPKEYRLAQVLLTRVGRVVTVENLLRLADVKSDNSLRVMLFQLRAKLARAGAVCVIRPVRGEGYTIDPPGERVDPLPK